MSELPLNPSLPINVPEPFAAVDGSLIPRTVCLQPGESVVVEVDPGVGTRLRITAEEGSYTSPGDGSLGADVTATAQAAAQKILGTSYPASVAMSANGARVYVVGSHFTLGYGALTVIDTATNQVIRVITLGVEAAGIALSPDDSRIYVSRHSNASAHYDIAIIDAVSLTIIGTIPTPGLNTSRLVTSPDGAWLYACSNTEPYAGYPSGRLAVIDSARGQIFQAIVLQQGSRGIAISPDGSRVYAANSNGTSASGSGTISVLDTRTLAVLKDIEVGVNPDGTVVSLDGTRVYTVRTIHKMLVVIDARTYTVIRNVPIGISAFFLALSPDGRYLCASNQDTGDGAVIIDTNTFSLRTLPITGACTGLAYSPDGARLYIANFTGSLVWVVDI